MSSKSTTKRPMRRIKTTLNPNPSAYIKSLQKASMEVFGADPLLANKTPNVMMGRKALSAYLFEIGFSILDIKKHIGYSDYQRVTHDLKKHNEWYSYDMQYQNLYNIFLTLTKKHDESHRVI